MSDSNEWWNVKHPECEDCGAIINDEGECFCDDMEGVFSG